MDDEKEFGKRTEESQVKANQDIRPPEHERPVAMQPGE